MKAKNNIIVMFIAASLSLPAQAEIYAIAKASYFTGLEDFDNEQSFGLVLGYQYNDRHAFELEAQVNGFDSTEPGFEVDADVFTYLLNYQNTFWQQGDWSARLGAGIGWAQPEFGTSAETRGSDNITIWQVGIGSDYQINNRFSATFDLRAQDFGKASEGDVSYDFGTPAVMSAGLRYNF